jgi:predicted transcriptional regulator
VSGERTGRRRDAPDDGESSANVEPDELFDLLGDEYVRAVLTATRGEPMSAQEISETREMSASTAYRRADALVEKNLVAEVARIDAEGNHYTAYEATLDGLDVDLTEHGFSVEVETVSEDAADRFTRIWEDIRGD